MNSMWEDIKMFHEKFLLPQNEIPALLEKEMFEFRMKFMQEELAEFEDACERMDIVKAFDALLDLVYVAMGTAYIMNVPWDDGWDEVQKANMMKMRALKASDSTRGSTYDVIKPKGWVAPDRMLCSVLIQHEHFLLVEKFRRMREEPATEVANG